MMEGKFGISVHAEFPLTAGIVPEADIPEFYRIFQGDKKGLFPPNAGIFALVFDIGKAVAAGICGGIQVFAYGLPGDRPVFPGFIVPDVDIVAGPVHGYAVGAETGNPVEFGAFVKKVAPRGMVKNAAKVPYADVIGPGNRDIDPVYYIFSRILVKISVFHRDSIA
jgi:hypothetical protein